MKDPLFSNKLAGAVLCVLLLFIGLPVIVHTMETLLSGHHGHESFEESFAYKPYEALVGVTGGPAEDVVEVSLGCLLAEADAGRGQRGAAICASCHSFDKGGANGTGPNLWNVMGRQVANVSGYGYSGALEALGGAWTYDKLDAYLYDSQGYVPGTQMAQKIRKDNKRADILAYLATLSDGAPLAFPECVLPEEEEVVGDETPMEEVAGEAADRADFAVPGPGEATLPDAEVNNPGADGYPGDGE